MSRRTVEWQHNAGQARLPNIYFVSVYRVKLIIFCFVVSSRVVKLINFCFSLDCRVVKLIIFRLPV